MHDLWAFDFKEKKKKSAAYFIYAFCPLREFTRDTMDGSSVSWKLNVHFSDFYALLTSIG